MSDTPEHEGPVSFTRWLFYQAKGDKDREMPYAGIYRWGKNINAILGDDGKFDSEWVALELSRQGANAEDLAALAAAEAAWRVDNVVDSAETAGVSLDVPGSAEEIVDEETSTYLEESSNKVLCGYRNHRGEGCVAEAVPGAGRCGRHGGAITDPEVRRSFLLVAFTKVLDGSRIAVEALLDVAENGRSEMARVQAAKELLDRAGVQQDQHVHIHQQEEDTSEDELVAALRARLGETKDRLRLKAVDDYSGVEDHTSPVPELEPANDDVVDAEIIEDSHANV